MLRRVVLIGAVLASTLAVAVPAGLAGPSAMTVKIGEQAQLVGTGIVLDVTYSCTQVNAAATGTLNVSVQELVGATSVIGGSSVTALKYLDELVRCGCRVLPVPPRP